MRNLRRIASLTLIIFLLCFVFVSLIVIRFRFLQGYYSEIKFVWKLYGNHRSGVVRF